jgi:hypothetical protein
MDSGSGITQNSPSHHTCRHRLPGRKTQPRRLPHSPCPLVPDQAPIAHKSKRTAATTNNGLEERESGLQTLGRGFLKKASQGMSMNRVTVRQPTRLAVSDSCPFGIGGFLSEGRAWCIQIPPSSPIYGESTANNFLEFLLGMVVNVWLMCETFTGQSESLLAIGDNTSAIGWLFRSGRIDQDSLCYDALQLGARKLATLIADSEHCLASQHIKGDANLVADLLSWSGDVRGSQHPLATRRFHSHLPQLIPEYFRISPLPSEILSWITLAL